MRCAGRLRALGEVARAVARKRTPLMRPTGPPKVMPTFAAGSWSTRPVRGGADYRVVATATPAVPASVTAASAAARSFTDMDPSSGVVVDQGTATAGGPRRRGRRGRVRAGRGTPGEGRGTGAGAGGGRQPAPDGCDGAERAVEHRSRRVTSAATTSAAAPCATRARGPTDSAGSWCGASPNARRRRSSRRGRPPARRPGSRWPVQHGAASGRARRAAKRSVARQSERQTGRRAGGASTSPTVQRWARAEALRVPRAV